MHRPSKDQYGFGVIEIILVVAILGVVGFMGWYILSQKTTSDEKKTDNSSSSQQNSQTTDKYTTFEGTLKNINRGCDADGVCSMTVDDKVIITGGGLGPSQEDDIWGVTDADLTPGDTVMVKALKDGDNYTLQRCANCYVRRPESSMRR